MNSSPFRGRGRGGGSSRPYFYFRRNGKTIPGGGNGEGGGAGAGGSKWRGRRGGGLRGPAGKVGDDNASLLDSSFLRPDFFAAPPDALQVQSIATDSPLQCPGFRLYFATEKFEEASVLWQRIKALERHYTNNAAQYDLPAVQRQCYFEVHAKPLLSDEAVVRAWPTLLEDLHQQPQRTLATLGVAMHSTVTVAAIEASLSAPRSTKTAYVPRYSLPRKIYVRPVGFRVIDMLANVDTCDLDRLWCVRGTVTAVGTVECAAAWVAYACARCKQEQALKQKGYYASRPYSCKRGDCHAKTGFLEKRSSPYTQIKPSQIIRLAENHIQAPDGSTEHIDIELCYDLVDRIYVGQDVIVSGVLKMRPLAEAQNYAPSNAPKAKTCLYLKALSLVEGSHVKQVFSESDLDAISAVNGEQDSFKLLVHSLTPEIHGQELVKAGLLLALLGGAGSQVHDDMDINVLLVGDPGIGKSHVLQMCARVSERGAINQNRRGSAATNRLTASMQGRSGLTIDAGTMLRSISGHSAIDDIDRLASQHNTLLRMMQTQLVSLPFASIFTTVHAPSSVIATANSMRGHYDHSKTLLENIRVSAALLREFHLVFLLVDKPNKDMDSSFTEHVRALHDGHKKSSTIAARFALKPKANNSMSISLEEPPDDDEENYDLGERLKLSKTLMHNDDEDEMDLLPPNLIRKFIAYARQEVKPLLTEDAASALEAFYTELRQQKADEKFNPMATSQLYGLIRLTQARARADFSAQATRAHVRDVAAIVRQCMADTAVGNYVDTNPATATTSAAAGGRAGVGKSGQVKKFLQMLQMRSQALGRRTFDFDELKEMARRAGIACGVTNLIDVVNLQGFLLKKGPNVYEVMED